MSGYERVRIRWNLWHDILTDNYYKLVTNSFLTSNFASIVEWESKFNFVIKVEKRLTAKRQYELPFDKLNCLLTLCFSVHIIFLRGEGYIYLSFEILRTEKGIWLDFCWMRKGLIIWRHRMNSIYIYGYIFNIYMMNSIYIWWIRYIYIWQFNIYIWWIQYIYILWLFNIYGYFPTIF